MKRIEEAVLNRVIPWATSQARAPYQRVLSSLSQSASPSRNVRDTISLSSSSSITHFLGYSKVGGQRFMSSLASASNFGSVSDKLTLSGSTPLISHVLGYSNVGSQRLMSTSSTSGLVGSRDRVEISTNSTSSLAIQALNTQSPRYGKFYSTFPTGDKPIDITNDYVIKGIFSDETRAKDFLENILIGNNKILPAGTKIKELEYLKNEHIQDKNPDDAKKVIFDLQIKTTHGIFIIEMQKNSSIDYLKRAEFYNAIAYSHQHIKGPSGNPYPMRAYTKALPIVTITILTKNMFHDKVPCVSYHVNREQKTQEQHMKAFSYVFIELEKFGNQKYDQSNIETENERDWLSLMKTQDLSHPYTNPRVNDAIRYVQDIRDNKYDEYIRHQMAELAARKELEEEVNARNIEIAKEMLKDGENIEKIIKYSKLAREEIEKLKNGE